MNYKVFFCFLLLIFWSCKDSTSIQKVDENEAKPTITQLKYAQGFNIKTYKNFKVLEISKPWKGSEKTYRFALISDTKNMKAETLIEKLSKTSLYDGVIKTPLESIVITSTTHIPALELLNVQDKLVGFPGMDYVSSKSVRTLIDNGKVKELGKNEGLNTEIVLELNPNAVITFGIEGVNKAAEIIQKANIPLIYNGEWIEDSPLAKAEWIKMFGVLFNKEKEAEQIFDTIEKEYLDAKLIAESVNSKPTVLSGAIYNSIWYLPNGKSPEAQLLRDANTNYLWKNTDDEGSLELSFESVFEKGQAADIWISPSYYGSYSDLEAANTLYKEFEAFKNKSIYSFVNTKGYTGGILYYELGVARPDLVLKDLIKLAHPTLMSDYQFTFFKPLLN